MFFISFQKRIKYFWVLENGRKQHCRLFFLNQEARCCFILSFTGGTMATDYASDAPEFWLHHGMLDSIWDEWQSKGLHFKYVGFTNQLNLTLLGFYPKEKRAEFLDNNNLGSCGVKIRYEDIIYHNNSKLKHHLHHEDPNNYSEDQYSDPVNNQLEDNHIHVFQAEYDDLVNNPNKVIQINYSQGEYYDPISNQYEDTYIHVCKLELNF